MLKIGILGTPVSSANRGVLALGASLVNLCSSSAQAEVVLFLGHRDNQPASFRIGGQSRAVPLVNCRLSPRSLPSDHLAWIVLACLLYRCVPLPFLRRMLSRVTPWIAALESVDFAGDVRGGDSFSDIYGMKGFIHGFLIACTVLLVKGTMVQFPQTYGPYKSPLARCLARYLLRRSSVIIARDQESQNVAQELVGPGREVWLSPDVAFSLETCAPEKLLLDPPLPSEFQLSAFSVSAFEKSVVSGPVASGPSSLVVPAPSSVLGPRSSVSRPPSSDPSPLSVVSSPSSVAPKPIGLNISGLMYNSDHARANIFGLKLDYRAFLPSLVVALLREHAGELWLVPHTYGARGGVEDDLVACHQVRAALPSELQPRIRLVTGEYDCHQLKYIIGQCDFFIGSRMHACIAALSQGLPAVGVAYSKKFAGVFDSVGMGDWVVDARQVSSEQALARILELFRTRHLVVDGLRQRSQDARAQLLEVFERLVVLPSPPAASKVESLQGFNRKVASPTPGALN